jgi:hypothetical protein
MTIDAALLRWCRPSALERLARALGVTLPPRTPETDVWRWRERAAAILDAALERDRWVARRPA